jgi:hypothetical protein
VTNAGIAPHHNNFGICSVKFGAAIFYFLLALLSLILLFAKQSSDPLWMYKQLV